MKREGGSYHQHEEIDNDYLHRSFKCHSALIFKNCYLWRAARLVVILLLFKVGLVTYTFSLPDYQYRFFGYNYAFSPFCYEACFIKINERQYTYLVYTKEYVTSHGDVN